MAALDGIFHQNRYRGWASYLLEVVDRREEGYKRWWFLVDASSLLQKENGWWCCRFVVVGMRVLASCKHEKLDGEGLYLLEH